MNKLGAIGKMRILPLLLTMAAVTITTALFTDVQNAAAWPVAEPDATTGVYSYLQLAQQNTFRVYAKQGEVINFSLYAGDRVGATGNQNLCADITLQQVNSNGTLTYLGGVREWGTEDNGTTFDSNLAVPIVGIAGQSNTCSLPAKIKNSSGKTVTNPNRYKPREVLNLSYKVTSNLVSSMGQAYVLSFNGRGSGLSTKDGHDAQGYKWRVSVNNDTAAAKNDPGKDRIPGRVWVVGNTDGGLGTWQRNPHADLVDNATTHTFRFVRADGYRYSVKYYNYQGIWSTFHGGLYGARGCSSRSGGLCTGFGLPVYHSYFEGDGVESVNMSWNKSTKYTYGTNGNYAYIFLDCGTTLASCPDGIPDSILKRQPITNDGNISADTWGNKWSQLDNSDAGIKTNSPIADANVDPNASNGFRYKGYTATNFAGGTVTIPYKAMQSGYIRLKVTVNGTLWCQKDILVDEPGGTDINSSNGIVGLTWQMKKDPSCGTGNKLTTANPTTIDPNTDVLVVSAQAIHLGEMHFVDVDTEQRGGIEVKGNGLTRSGHPEDATSIIWNDPYSRIGADTCGSIPPRVGAGLPQGAAPNPASRFIVGGNNVSPDANLWGSMSSGVGAGVDRSWANSMGGVHGWLSASGCDAYDNGGDDQGYAFSELADQPNTATSESTWGNNRVLEDWTYAFADAPARKISLGGPQYELNPTVTLSPASSISPGQSVQVTNQVQNTGRSKATNVRWLLFEIVFRPGASVDKSPRTGTDGTQFACSPNSRAAAAGAGLQSCTLRGSSPGQGYNATFDANLSTALTPYLMPQADTAGLPVGSTICFTLLVDPYTQDGGYSEGVSCVVVAAAPYVSVIGGNTWAGGSTVKDPVTGYFGSALIRGASSSGFGSYGEYGVFATDTVDFFGSAAKLGVTKFGTAVSPGAKLTFGSNIAMLGKFNTTHKITDMAAQYVLVASSPVLTGSVVTGSGVYKVSGTGTVGLTGIAGKNKAVIYVPEGTVFITNNIVYDTAGATTFKDLPSLTVIANNIVVTSGVSEIAGNFYASGRFVTCSEAPWSSAENGVAPLGKSAAISTSGVCSQRPLTINGTLTIANQAVNSLVLNRSSGGITTGQSAEIIRMRPESFLTSYENSLQLQTVYETELPARY